jgi:hypothetical protein
MDSLRNIFQLGGGNIPPGRESPNLTRCTSIPKDAQSWELVNNVDDQSAPNVAGWFGCQGVGVHFELQGPDTWFTLGDPGTVQNALAEVTQTWGDVMDLRIWDTKGGETTPVPAGQATQATTTFLTLPYSDLSAAIQRWGTGNKVS